MLKVWLRLGFKLLSFEIYFNNGIKFKFAIDLNNLEKISNGSKRIDLPINKLLDKI